MNRITPVNITQLEPNQIFVFGSNEAGYHGKGAAFIARKKFGAVQYIGFGLTGKCYAIPTKDASIRSLPLTIINVYVDQFIEYAKKHPDYIFLVTKIGCGLAGYKPEDIAPMFKKALTIENIYLPKEFII